jgi:hypothetical protein
MPREPKPYAYRGWYCTSARGLVNQRLCPVSQGMNEAKRLLYAHLAEIDAARREFPSPGKGVRPQADPTKVLLCDAHDDYLDAVKSEVTQDTYDGYVRKLKPLEILRNWAAGG